MGRYKCLCERRADDAPPLTTDMALACKQAKAHIKLVLSKCIFGKCHDRLIVG